MYVYADILLLINIVMNSVILILTALATGIAGKAWRIVGAALLGALYALGGLFPALAPLYTPAVKLLAALALVLLAFGPMSWRPFLLAVAAFYLVSLLLGGAVLGWLLLVSPPGWPVLPQTTWRHLAAGALLALLLVGIVWRRLLAGLTRRRLLLPLVIGYAGRQVRITALLDTGNHLYTPGSRRPVVLVDQAGLEPILGSLVGEYLRRTPPVAWITRLDQCPDREWLARVQIIPCRGVGGESLLLAFRPDSLTVITAAGSATAADAVIGIHSGRLSPAGAYAALLHPAVLRAIDIKGEDEICA